MGFADGLPLKITNRYSLATPKSVPGHFEHKQSIYCNNALFVSFAPSEFLFQPKILIYVGVNSPFYV